MFKTLVQQIDAAAEKWLPLPQDERVTAWANLHSWDINDVESQRLLLRQALLNVAICQTVPGIKGHILATPLDILGVGLPPALTDAIFTAAQSSASFNFWGELYSALIPQAQRRRIGQFWTNEQIAEWMVAWLLQSSPRYLSDVGCGAGNFLLKAIQLLRAKAQSNRIPVLYGCDISPLMLNITLAAFLTKAGDVPLPWPELTVQDYLDASLPAEADAVVCNPPYTRHHHITPAQKDALQAFFKTRFFSNVSRQGTLAFYFLLKLVAEMPDGAHAAVIVPMEVLDARYGKAAKRILCQHTALSAIVHFAPQMNAFRRVDVGATILLFRKGYEKHNRAYHLILHALPTTSEFLDCLETKYTKKWDLSFGSVVIQPQDELLEIAKWSSIAAPEIAQGSYVFSSDRQSSALVVPLKALAKVMRGIATGANEFFVLPTSQVKRHGLEPHVVRTLHRNREIQDIILDETGWQTLSNEGKCVWLLYLNGNDVSGHPQLCDYLAEGEKKGYHRRSLAQTRKQWYAMEQRAIPPIFFTLLTRGNPRFILNRAGVRPLNMFLLLYPNQYMTGVDATEILWALLNSTFSLSRLHAISRTYGGNTLKVEPRELDNLPVINPLALPENVRQEIKTYIDDFHRHRQASVLTHQIDRLVETLLAAETTREYQSSLPIQLGLLETKQNYKGKTD